MFRVGWFFGYILAEIAALYALLMLVTVLLVTFSPMPNKEIVLIFTAVSGIPASIMGATVGYSYETGRGFYHPIRLLAGFAQVIGITLDGSTVPLLGNRQPIDISYSGSDLASYDVLTALSEHLRAKGIAHTASGGIAVEDNGTSWWLEAEFGAKRLTGWVQSGDPRDRTLVVNAIRAFLAKELRLRLA